MPYQGQALSAAETKQPYAVHRAPEGYYRTANVFQASGIGKTRICDELTKQVFTIGFRYSQTRAGIRIPKGWPGPEILQFLRAKNVHISVAITALLASCLRNGEQRLSSS